MSKKYFINIYILSQHIYQHNNSMKKVILPAPSSMMNDERNYPDYSIVVESLNNLNTFSLEDDELDLIPKEEETESMQSNFAHDIQTIDPVSFLSLFPSEMSLFDQSSNADLPIDCTNSPGQQPQAFHQQLSAEVKEKPIDEVHFMEEERESSESSSPYLQKKVNDKGKTKKRGRGKTNQELRKDYGKNIVCNITKRLAELIFGKWSKVARTMCEQNGVTYESLKETFQKKMLSVSGPNKLYELLISGNTCSPILCETLKSLIQVVLRRGYLPQIVRDGRMSHKEEYIRFKNEYLLYFPYN